MTEIKGELIQKFDTKSYGSNGFTKREFVVKTKDKYPQEIIIELNKEKCSLLDKYNIGDNISVGININGRSWTSPQGQVKYFNSLVGWKIEGDAIPNNTPQEASTPSKPQPKVEEYQDDGLPF